jgi:SAM-dependent methyltransferase
VTITTPQIDATEAFLGRLFDATIDSLDLASVYLGERLGMYAALADQPLTSAQLADRLSLDERYVREWLEQQAVTGVLAVDGVDANADARRYVLPAAHATVLLDRDSPSFFAPQSRCIASVFATLPQVMRAFRDGRGVPYERYGSDFSEGLGLCNRASFVNLLGSEWLPAITDVDRRLRDGPPARVADVACGIGWSTISIAHAYPNVTVDGLDIDPHSIATARANLAESGVADRVSFRQCDAADPDLEGQYDLITVFEALHDMPDPVRVLSRLRLLLAPAGALIVVDERAADRFAAPGDDVQRMLYGFSVVHCLPVATVDRPSVATGTVMRPGTFRTYARDAGFTGVEVLPIENDFWRFYRLTP